MNLKGKEEARAVTLYVFVSYLQPSLFFYEL